MHLPDISIWCGDSDMVGDSDLIKDDRRAV